MLANFVLIRWNEPADGRRSFSLVLPRSMSGTVTKRLKMFVLRSKVTITEDSHESVIMGIGGPDAGRVLQSVLGPLPSMYRLGSVGAAAILPVPGPRYMIASPLTQARELWEKLERVARPVGYPAWQWLTIRAGVPVVTPATTDQWVPQMANLDALGGINFQKGCYTGQEIVARTQYLGRLKERLFLLHADDGAVPLAGERLYSSTFGDQACGTVVSAAVAPGGGSDLLAVIQIAAAVSGDVRHERVGGGSTALTLLDLPYALPPAAAPRTRIA
jgi:folate-binding protein YgfZ